MSSLRSLLDTFRTASVTEREKGTYFEELILCYLRNEATYRDLYAQVWTYAEWAKQQGMDSRDAGIDLVAQTATGEFHAIQCKFYAEDYRLQKGDIDSFFTASGKKPFTHRIIVSHDQPLERARRGCAPRPAAARQQDRPPRSGKQPDRLGKLPARKPRRCSRAKKQLRDHQKTALAAVSSAACQTADRGKLIMACGTGKTFTSLKIAEKLAGKGKRVLFLVPSLDAAVADPDRMDAGKRHPAAQLRRLLRQRRGQEAQEGRRHRSNLHPRTALPGHHRAGPAGRRRWTSATTPST